MQRLTLHKLWQAVKTTRKHFIHNTNGLICFSHRAPENSRNTDKIKGDGLAFRYLIAAQRQKGLHGVDLHANF